MTTLALLALTVVSLAGAVGLGLAAVTGWAESRRRVRWSHALCRFCGDDSCGVCRSRSLSREVPRLSS